MALIKILTDENISPKVVSFLRKNGFDVLDAKEQHWCGKDDEALLNTAYREQRFVMTHDSDFGTLAINEKKPYHGIIYLRVKNSKPGNVMKVCEQLFRLDIDFSPRTILVVEELRIRVRQFSEEL